MSKRPRLFYGWVILIITVISMTVIYGIRNNFGVFFPELLEEFGWGRGSTALMFSLSILVYGFVAPVAGYIGDRWKPRRVMMISLVLLSLVTAGCALSNELWQFYLIYGILVPVWTAFCGWPLFAPALANWFAKRRGLVMGLGQMGVGLSYAYGIFTEFIMSQLGWRMAFVVLAGVLILVPLPLYLLWYYRPEERGLKALGLTEVAVSRDILTYDWTLGSALKTYQLWLLVFAQFFYWGIAGYLLVAHQVKFAEDVGYSSLFAAGIFAIYGVFIVVGFLTSIVSDWISREMTITLASLLAIGAVAALLATRDTSQPWLLYVYAIAFGYGGGLYTPTATAAMADIFHGRSFGAIVALLLTGMGLGAGIGPWLGGYIHDITGSYAIAFFVCIGSFAIACIFFWLAAPRNATKLRAEKLKAH